MNPLAPVTRTDCRDDNEPALRPAVPGSEEIPQDQAQHRQQHDRDGPDQLLLVGNGALEDIDDRPDIAGEDQDAPEAAVPEVHHSRLLAYVAIIASPRSVVPEGRLARKRP